MQSRSKCRACPHDVTRVTLDSELVRRSSVTAAAFSLLTLPVHPTTDAKEEPRDKSQHFALIVIDLLQLSFALPGRH